MDKIEFMKQCIEKLRNNDLDSEGLLKAQTICLVEQDNPLLKSLIDEYASIADIKTDGAFSASIDAWKIGKGRMH